MLNIVRDKTHLTDKNANLFCKALTKEGERQGVEINTIIVDSQENTYNIDFNKPTIVIDPFDFIPVKCFNNVDLDTTATVCFDIIKDLPPSNVILIGRGNIGRVIADLIIDESNHTLTVANSKTTQEYLEKLVKDADIIINTSTSEIHTNLPMFDKMLIDINNNFKCNVDTLSSCVYWNMRDIGKLTVQQIISRAKDGE